MVKWQIKNVISPLSQGLWILNLASSWLKTREPPPTKSCDTSITWLGDKSKTFYLHIHKAHGPQNLVGCWLRMRGSHLKSHVTLQLYGQMENQKHHIFSTIRPSRCKKKVCARHIIDNHSRVLQTSNCARVSITLLLLMVSYFLLRNSFPPNDP